MVSIRRLLDFADDRVIVSSRVWFPDEGDFVSRLRIEPVRVVRRNGRVGVDLKTRESIEGNDSVVRQESFERAVESHLDALQSAGLGSDLFADSSAEVAIYVSLAPHHGQAGVVVPPPLMSRLVQLDASLFVDSL